jgi:hypothetical protein
MPLIVLAQQVELPLEVTAVERLEQAADYLHVRFRHAAT